MSLFKTTFGRFQQDTHSRESTVPHLYALSSKASAWASGAFTPHQRRQHTAIFTDLQQKTTMPAVLEIHQQLQEYPLSLHLNSQGSTKVKRISDPLNKAVRESLCGNSTDHVAGETPYSTSGSDHDIDFMAPGFLEENEEKEACSTCPRPDFSEDCGSDEESSDVHDVNSFLGDQIREMLQGISHNCTRQEQMLLRDVNEALRIVKEKDGFLIENEGQKSSLRRFLMSKLRCRGYNAGICKSRWEKTNGYPAGDYEFIDVVVEGCRSMAEANRLLVDIDFRAQFEIARPTNDYNALVRILPIIFVGRADKLRQMIRIMCDAARRSLKSKGMHIPPWRKPRYLQAKWVGRYKRTTNPTCTSHLHGGYAAMAALNSVGMGMGWDASFTQQMHLYFQQAMREANKRAPEMLKTQGKEQVLNLQTDLQSWQLQGKHSRDRA